MLLVLEMVQGGGATALMVLLQVLLHPPGPVTVKVYVPAADTLMQLEVALLLHR